MIDTLRHTDALRRVAKNLLARQDVSVYAARALPGLLHELGDSEKLFDLAFNEHIPAINNKYGWQAEHTGMQGSRLPPSMLQLTRNTIASGSGYLVELSTIAADRSARGPLHTRPSRSCRGCRRMLMPHAAFLKPVPAGQARATPG